MNGVVAYTLSKKFTKDTVEGMGAIKGAPCQVQSINKVGDTTTITLKWEDNLGVDHTQSFEIKDGIDGLDGVSVVNAIIDSVGDLILTLSDSSAINCGKVLPQYNTLPTASSVNEGRILQYVGTTTPSFTNGYFYICREVSEGVYDWIQKNVQPSSGGGGGDGVVDGYYNSADQLFYEDSAFLNPITGEDNTIYVDLNTNGLYRYDGTIFIKVSSSTDSYTKAEIGDLSDLPDTSKNVIENIDLLNENIDLLNGSVLNKIQKMLGAQENNFTVIDNNGGVKDSGISKNVVPTTASISNKLLVASDLSVKADKVSGAVDNDIALLDSTGNLKDSTKKLSDLQDKLTEGNGIDIDTNNKISVDISYLTASRVGYIPSSEKGAHGGVAELDSTGKVPSSQLPSYIDDVIDGYYNDIDGKFYVDSAYTTEITGESDKIYISVDTDIQYRWTGTAFTALGGALQLGETSSTAYRGDRGKIAYDHSQIKDGSNPHNTTADNINLKVPIPALSGSKLDVESTLYGVNTELGKKADKVVGATNGHLAGLDSNGNLTDSRVVANDVIQKVATATGLLKDDGTVDTTEYQSKQLSVPIETLSGSQLTVETALNGINDDVVKTFTGTQAQWDALSLADKQKYEICNITDDGSTDNVYTVGEVDVLLDEKLSYADNGILGAKNLLPNNGKTSTVNGVTFTVNFNGSVTVNGTATADTQITIYNGEFKAGNYIVSKGNMNEFPIVTIYSMAKAQNLAVVQDTEVPVTIDNSDANEILSVVWVSSGTTVTNQTVYPMIRLASDSDDTYQPYAMTNKDTTNFLKIKSKEISNGLTIAAGAVEQVTDSTLKNKIFSGYSIYSVQNYNIAVTQAYANADGIVVAIKNNGNSSITTGKITVYYAG